VAQVSGSEQLQIDLCRYLIDWCVQQKRTPLKHRVELKLAGLLLTTGKPDEALRLIEPILLEVRKADDKHLLVELFLAESKINYSIKNFAKAKASLTASRAASNSVYCQPLLLA
jgi:26S proteasome regulatory subunit N6